MKSKQRIHYAKFVWLNFINLCQMQDSKDDETLSWVLLAGVIEQSKMGAQKLGQNPAVWPFK